MKLKTILLILTIQLITATSAFAVHEARETQPINVSASASLTYYPKFISRRGFEVGEGSVQPSASVIYGPFSLNAWSTYNLDSDEFSAPHPLSGTTGDITETDWWATYTKSLGKLTATGGYFFEAYDPNNTYELFLVLHYDTFLQPGFEVYWDPDEGDGGTFFFATISHSFQLPKKIALNLNAWVNYNNENVLYGDFSDFYNGQVAASLSIPITKDISIVPRVGYSIPLSDDAKTVLECCNKSGESEHFWGGVSFVLAFSR